MITRKPHVQLPSTALPVGILSIAFLLYALSDHVAIGGRELFAYSYPALLEPLTGTFRASGRFAWPAVYVLLLAVFSLFFKSLERNKAAFTLALLFIVQSADLTDESARLRERWNTKWQTPLASSFWTEVPQLYRRIAFVTPSLATPNYGPLALLASDHRMTVNGGYFARVDPIKLLAVQEGLRNAIEKGIFRSDTLYVFNDDALWSDAMDTFDRNGFIGTVDGLKVVAPGYHGCIEKCGLRTPSLPPKYQVGSVVDFGKNGNVEMFQQIGWHAPEPEGRWTAGRKSKVSLTLDDVEADAYNLRFTLRPFVAGSHARQRVSVAVNGQHVAEWELSDPHEVVKTIPLKGEAIRSAEGKVSITFSMPDAVVPLSVAVSNDERVLGLFVKNLKISAEHASTADVK
jgi:hypothetical protein